MILYIKNPKRTTKKLLELINKFGKVAGYKINIQKHVAFLYTNNKLSERENKKTILFTIASKRIKYLGINLTKELKDLYSKIYKTLMKVIVVDTNRWKNILCLWIGRINIVKMTILPRQSTVQCNPYQNTNDIFHRARTNNSKIFMETQKTLNNQNILEKEEQSWRYHAP